MIDFSHVTKRYYMLTALNDVSIAFPQGEIIGLLGPNGAGKSTVIKLIAGIIFPTEGEVLPAGAKWPGIGYKPERLVFPGNMMVGQYLEMVAGLCNIDRRSMEETVLQSLARVNLLGSAQRQIKTLSKGMRQRLGLAQALIGDPELLLLDEPSSGLDPEGQVEMLTYIEELRSAGKTILMSSHQLQEVTQVCTTLIILNNGRVHYQNRVADALTLQPYVIIQADRPLLPAKDLLAMVHPDISIDGNSVILHNSAIAMRRQVLAILINNGYDILRVDQKRVTLAEIYAEAVQ